MQVPCKCCAFVFKTYSLQVVNDYNFDEANESIIFTLKAPDQSVISVAVLFMDAVNPHTAWINVSLIGLKNPSRSTATSIEIM